MQTDIQTLIEALKILARDIQSDDGIANAAILEGAQRIEELQAQNTILLEALSGVYQYGSDTLSGPLDAPCDLNYWHREAVVEMTKRAKQALAATPSECLDAIRKKDELIFALIKHGRTLSFMAQTSGGTVGQDAKLVMAIDAFSNVIEAARAAGVEV